MANSKRRTIFATSVALAGFAVAPLDVLQAGASSTSTFPVVVKTANGNIGIKHRPTAIVSLSATSTEMLYAIGAGSQVKAVDQYSNYPKNAPRTNLNGFTPNIEAIVKENPDLVIVENDTSGVTKELAAFGIPVLAEPAATSLANEYSQFYQLGMATGHVTQAHAEVSKIKRDINEIVKSTPRPKSANSYYFELSSTYYSATSSTYIGQVLGLLGLKSIADSATGAAASGGYPQLSAEYIIAANPSMIFLADIACCTTPSSVAQRPGWSSMSAVRMGRILSLNPDIATRWGPRVVNLLRAVSDFLKKRSHT